MGCLVHALTILVVWSLGRAQGLALPVTDAAVLFTVMVGVTIVPISIGGWGLRELAVVSLLSDHGVAPANALLFSVEFGLTLAIASLPGAFTWLLYPISPIRSALRSHPPGIESTEMAGVPGVAAGAAAIVRAGVRRRALTSAPPACGPP